MTQEDHDVDIDIELCGVEDKKHGLSSCVREEGHDGPHYFWRQEPWGEGSGVFGVQIYDGDTEKMEWAIEMRGKSNAVEVAVLVAYFEAYRDVKKRRSK